MIHIDKVTQQRIVYDRYSGDIQYDLVGDKAISQETVPVIGDWEDYTGSAVVDSRAQQMFAGQSNSLQGTEAGIKGAKIGNLGIVGQDTQTTRRRTIKRHVDLNGNKS
tara:strand:- start:1830 stop:2153 length:324 start_codon:yes stop_codon:yes gene_type:complete